MKFKNSDEAWAFCLSCGGQKGFEIRKRYTNKRSADGKVANTFVTLDLVMEGLTLNDHK
uniref:Uncharacterized protein n=1 Tax=Triticum urartu TaxID=4572 RepID=A0A8R7UEY7_TRIUA